MKTNEIINEWTKQMIIQEAITNCDFEMVDNLEENGKEGHDEKDAAQVQHVLWELISNASTSNIFNMIVSFSYQDDEFIKVLREIMGQYGNGFERKVLDCIEKLHLNRDKNIDMWIKDTGISNHNSNPKKYSHPDKIDIKNSPTPNLPRE